MSIIEILTTPPTHEGGTGGDHCTVVTTAGQWYFVDYTGAMPTIFTCSGEAEALSRLAEADSGSHRPGCRCLDCFDPTAERRRHTPARSREWQ